MCGVIHMAAESRGTVEATYDYRDETGQLLFQVIRYGNPKTFKQRRPDGAGGWNWKMEDSRRVLYRLRELLGADPSLPVYIAEGEKDVDALRRLGAVATCNPGGAKKWSTWGSLVECWKAALADRHVVVIPDIDSDGQEHAEQVMRALRGNCQSIRVLPLPGDGKDASDWIDDGGTTEGLAVLSMGARVLWQRPTQTSEPPNTPPTPSVDPPPVDDDGFKQALADVKSRLGVVKSAARKPLFTLDAVELLQRTFDGARWLITGLVTRGGVTMIGAEPKAAKTWLGTELAIAVATGTPACGEFYAEHGVVAYFYAEDMDVQIRNRVRALLAGHGRTIAADRLKLEPRGSFLDITRDEDLAWVVASARRISGLDLLILDPLRDIHSGEEDKSDSMREVMRRLRALAEILGCTVAVVHHSAKATKDTSKRRPGQNLRGSSAIHGSIDSGLYLEDTGGDGTTLFTNTVVSQVKGARSAGRFGIELSVTDNQHGEAVRAQWTYVRNPGGSKDKSGSEKDRLMFEFIRSQLMRGVSASKTQFSQMPESPLGERYGRDAINRLVNSGRLADFRGKISMPTSTENDDED